MCNPRLDSNYRELNKFYKKFVRKGFIKPFTLSNGYKHSGNACKCWYCGSDAVRTTGSIYSDSSIVEVRCTQCGNLLSHHEYGHYEYNFPIKGGKEKC